MGTQSLEDYPVGTDMIDERPEGVQIHGKVSGHDEAKGQVIIAWPERTLKYPVKGLPGLVHKKEQG